MSADGAAIGAEMAPRTDRVARRPLCPQRRSSPEVWRFEFYSSLLNPLGLPVDVAGSAVRHIFSRANWRLAALVPDDRRVAGCRDTIETPGLGSVEEWSLRPIGRQPHRTLAQPGTS
jgi:hypothetical protein